MLLTNVGLGGMMIDRRIHDAYNFFLRSDREGFSH